MAAKRSGTSPLSPTLQAKSSVQGSDPEQAIFAILIQEACPTSTQAHPIGESQARCRMGSRGACPLAGPGIRLPSGKYFEAQRRRGSALFSQRASGSTPGRSLLHTKTLRISAEGNFSETRNLLLDAANGNASNDVLGESEVHDHQGQSGQRHAQENGAILGTIDIAAQLLHHHGQGLHVVA